MGIDIKSLFPLPLKQSMAPTAEPYCSAKNLGWLTRTSEEGKGPLKGCRQRAPNVERGKGPWSKEDGKRPRMKKEGAPDVEVRGGENVPEHLRHPLDPVWRTILKLTYPSCGTNMSTSDTYARENVPEDLRHPLDPACARARKGLSHIMYVYINFRKPTPHNIDNLLSIITTCRRFRGEVAFLNLRVRRSAGGCPPFSAGGSAAVTLHHHQHPEVNCSPRFSP